MQEPESDMVAALAALDETPEVAQGLNQPALDALWQRLRADGDAQARESLICHHLGMARVVAKVYYGRRRDNAVEFGDYLQWATLGMIEALDRFDPEHGVRFQTFASWRMHGRILDGLTHSSEKQEQIAWRARLQSQRLQAVRAAAATTGAPSNLTRDSGPDSDTRLLQYLAEVGVGLALCWLLDDTHMVQRDGALAPNLPCPYAPLELEQLRQRLRTLVADLPPQQRTVIRCHYLQEMPFESIAHMLRLSRGRISQIHHQALDHLRQQLRQQHAHDVTL